MDRFQAELDCRLKELDLLQSEMDRRLDRHANSFYYSVTLMAGMIVATATALTVNDGKVSRDAILASLIFVPWLTMPLAAMFFDDELWRAITSIHIDKLVVHITKLLKSQGCDTEEILRYTIGARLGLFFKQKVTNPREAANARRWFFAIPFAVSFVDGLWLCLRWIWFHHDSNHPYLHLWSYWVMVILGVLGNGWLGWLLYSIWKRSRHLWTRIEKRAKRAIQRSIDTSKHMRAPTSFEPHS